MFVFTGGYPAINLKRYMDWHRETADSAQALGDL
jgi:hypothetical protein